MNINLAFTNQSLVPMTAQDIFLLWGVSRDCSPKEVYRVHNLYLTCTIFSLQLGKGPVENVCCSKYILSIPARFRLKPRGRCSRGHLQ